MIRFQILAAAAALTAPLSPVQAGSADAPKIEVGYRDLDLNTVEGRTRLEARIASAARKMCSADGVRDLGMLKAAKACYRSAMASAQPQIAALEAQPKRATV